MTDYERDLLLESCVDDDTGVVDWDRYLWFIDHVPDGGWNYEE